MLVARKVIFERAAESVAHAIGSNSAAGNMGHARPEPDGTQAYRSGNLPSSVLHVDPTEQASHCNSAATT